MATQAPMKDKIEFIERVYTVFGNSNGRKWMEKNLDSLDGDTPFNTIRTLEGLWRCEKLLSEIEYTIK